MSQLLESVFPQKHSEDAAKLPEIEIKKPDSILAKETITSMQAGLVYGQIGQTEYIVRHMKEEANLGEIKGGCHRWTWTYHCK